MSLPRPKWYTAEALAKCWGVDVNSIHSYNEEGRLKAKLKFKDVLGTGNCYKSDAYENIKDMMLHSSGMQYIGKYYKLEEVERFEKKHGINTTPVQEEYPLVANTQGNKTTTPQGTDSSIDDIISNITIRYENDDSITIQQKAKPQEVINLTALNFKSGGTKRTWKNFLAVLQSPPNYYWECRERPLNQLKVIDERLIKWMTDNLKIKFPAQYRLYDRVKTEPPGTYSFKFNIEYSDTIQEDESSRETFRKKFFNDVENYKKEPDHFKLKKLNKMAREGMIKKFLTAKEVRDSLAIESPKNKNNTIIDDKLTVVNKH